MEMFNAHFELLLPESRVVESKWRRSLFNRNFTCCDEEKQQIWEKKLSYSISTGNEMDACKDNQQF